MTDYIKGDGTPGNPLTPGARARAVLAALMAYPRAQLSDIRQSMVQGGASGASVLNKDMLVEDGVFARLVRYRVSVLPRRHVESADVDGEDLTGSKFGHVSGTCFIEVIAVGNVHEHRLDFFELLDGIDGIIEWDEIGGSGIDYLIRVAHVSESPRIDAIVNKLVRHPLVAKARTMQIRRSRIVDNFKPEDFLCFSDD